jgi:hypothetical protein
MKFRSLLLMSILAAGASLTVSAFGQEDKGKTQTPDQTQAQPADQTQTPAQPAATQDPSATAPDADQDTDKGKKSKQKIKHDGSKQDVDAIGNRKMGGLDWYSIESEIKMGKQ